jgi:hypothetical protein
MNKIVSEDERRALAQVSGSLKDLLQSSLLSAQELREKLRNEEDELKM